MAGRMPYAVRWDVVFYTPQVGSFVPNQPNSIAMVLDDERLPDAPRGLGSSWWENFIDGTAGFDLSAAPASFAAQSTAPLTFLRMGAVHANAGVLATIGVVNTANLGLGSAAWDLSFVVPPNQAFDAFGDEEMEGLVPSTTDANVQIVTDTAAGKNVSIWAQVK